MHCHACGSSHVNVCGFHCCMEPPTRWGPSVFCAFSVVRGVGSQFSHGLFLRRYCCRRRCRVSVLYKSSFVLCAWSYMSRRWVQWSLLEERGGLPFLLVGVSTTRASSGYMARPPIDARPTREGSGLGSSPRIQAGRMVGAMTAG